MIYYTTYSADLIAGDFERGEIMKMMKVKVVEPSQMVLANVRVLKQEWTAYYASLLHIVS